ncbi:Gmad2 immunoglobulin-like domain-containing protein [Neobacillus drentensis]|uniref:Gmad2 immunoglobulin-like domain-containing protein n=1 Tax=Neobacillus drentensis TaxID=220684 RepID=UPI002FFF859C
MKKIAYLFAILMAAIGLVACNQQQETVKEKPSVTAPKDVQEPDNEVVEEGNNAQEPKDEDTTNPNDPVTNGPEDKVYQNEVFKDVVVTETADKIIVTGKAQVFEGVFQYALYDGEKVLKESNYQTAGAPAWGEFEIIFEKELVSTKNAKFELFVYSPKDGSKVNTLEIPLPKP